MPVRLSRRETLALGLKGLGSALAGRMLPSPLAAAPAAGGRRKMNVLFIAVDDLRPQLGCYGHAQMVSPNIDRLAASGMTFERTYCQQAVCACSRSSLLTGCRPDTTRVWDLQTPLPTTMPNVLTLPQHFKANGYTTISLGKIYHHGIKDDPKGWSDTPWRATAGFMGYASPETETMRTKAWEEGGKEGKFSDVRGPAFEAADMPDTAYPDGLLADETIKRLRELKDQPFFLAAGFLKPHLPFACPKKYWDLYDHAKIDLADNPFKPKGCPDIAMHTWGELRSYLGTPKEGPVSEELARNLVHGYYACVSFTDALIGKVTTELDRLGLRQNTVVILWGDHGWNLGEHGLWCKHCNFETSVHAPMVVSVPGQATAGKKSAALTEFVDIYPTLAELCGLSLPEHLEGTSVVPLLEKPDRPWKSAAFSQYPRGRVMGYSMKTDQYRYTEWIGRQDKQVVGRELYDHRKDPGENVSLAEEPANKALVETLSRALNTGWKAALPV